jgi:hypothetical protein
MIGSRFCLLCLLGTSSALVVAAACSLPPSDGRFIATPPDGGASFEPVSDLLDHRCGTLDCHGTTARNLRLYGSDGLRIDGATTGDGGRPSSRRNTTQAEYDANYASLVGLEPEVMSAVAAQGGAQPERLTFVRKARGAEDHKGGTIWQAGDDQDRCISVWLAGKPTTADCTKACLLRPPCSSP